MQENNYRAAVNIEKNKLSILLKSLLIGIIAGFLITFYRFTLVFAEKISFSFYAYIRENLLLIPALILGLLLLALFTGFLVSKNFMIAGSGIPQVKGIIMGYLKDSWLATFVMKFVGGAAAILGGLSLGREGPSIQLGSAIADGVGKRSSSRVEKKILMASGAGAGLAAAFNSPLAGAMFAMEEIFKYFSPLILLSTMISAVSADFIATFFFNLKSVFSFDITASIPLNKYWIVVLMGIFLGFAGAFYNFILINTQKFYQRVKWLSAKTRPIIPFLIAGILGIVFPIVLCSGHVMIDQISLNTGIKFLLILLVVKFAFSMVSFASGAPGGIFFPLLLLGAVTGAIFGTVSVNFFGVEPALFYNFVVLAMAGFFTAIVRAPITGIILLIEMTGNFTELLAITVISVVAYFVADALKSAPVYDSLLYNMVLSKRSETFKGDEHEKVTVEVIVHHGSNAEGKKLHEIALPKKCLLVAVRRNGRDFIPNGQTQIMANDYLIFITSTKSESRVRRRLSKLTFYK